LIVHLPKFFGLFEAIGTAIGRILAFEIEVSASLAWCIAIAFYLPALAFIARYTLACGLLHIILINIPAINTKQW
jgi:hypothetical protein